MGRREASGDSYLLPGVDVVQGSHLAVLVSPEHFAHGAGGRLTGEAVDVHPLILVVFTPQLLRRFRFHAHKPENTGRTEGGLIF